MSASEVRSMDIREVVKDQEWQAIRRSFLLTWKRKPVENCAVLREYLDRDPSNALKIRRVLNYLTGSAFRIGTISHPSIDELLRDVRLRWRSLLSPEKGGEA